MSAEKSKPTAPPEVLYNYDKESESLCVTVELPGAEEDSIDLNLAVCGFCIEAESAEKRYEGCFQFHHEVNPDAATKSFEGGVLSIKIPFFEPLYGKKFPIHPDEDS